MAQHELEPFAVLQQLALVRWRKKDSREIERQRRSEAVGEIGRVEQHEVRALARLPIEQRGNAGIDALGGFGGDARLHTMLLGEMDQEGRGFPRAPVKRRHDKMKLLPLPVKRYTP